MILTNQKVRFADGTTKTMAVELAGGWKSLEEFLQCANPEAIHLEGDTLIFNRLPEAHPKNNTLSLFCWRAPETN